MTELKTAQPEKILREKNLDIKNRFKRLFL